MKKHSGDGTIIMKRKNHERKWDRIRFGLMAREGRAVKEYSGDGTITFLVDSGASSHFVRPGTLLHDVVPYQGCVMIASGGTISLNKNRQASL